MFSLKLIGQNKRDKLVDLFRAVHMPPLYLDHVQGIPNDSHGVEESVGVFYRPVFGIFEIEAEQCR